MPAEIEPNRNKFDEGVIQINLSKDGNAMSLLCTEDNWPDLRSIDLHEPGTIEVIGTDGERIRVAHKNVICIVYMDTECRNTLHEKQQEAKAQQARREALKQRSGIVPSPGMKEH